MGSLSAIPGFNNTIIPCSDDRHCPGSSLCVYENELKNNSNGICGCGPEWGNSGILCEIYGATSYYKISIYSIFIILFTFIILFVFRDILALYKLGLLRTFNITVTTLLECLFGCIASILYHIAGILWTIYPERWFMFYDNVNGYRKNTSYLSFRSATSGLIAFFHISMILNIGILWLQVAIASKRFQKLTSPQITKKYTILIVIIDVAMVISLVATFAVAPSLVGLAAAPVGVFVVVLYFYCAFSISKVINKQVTESDQEVIHGSESPTTGAIRTEAGRIQSKRIGGENRDAKMREGLRRIQIVATITVICELIGIIGASASSVVGLRTKRNYIKPTTLYPPAVLLDLANFEMIIVFATMAWYIHKFVEVNQEKNSKHDVPVKASQSNQSTKEVGAIITPISTPSNTPPSSPHTSLS